jgi:hypothetical protein
VRADRARLAQRSFEAAVRKDPTLAERHDEAGLRRLLRDTESLIERVALSVAGDDPFWTREWAEWVVPVFRRRRVKMDDLVTISDGIRETLPAVLSPEERRPADDALDAAVKVFRWNRRLGGDRRRHPLIDAIYKGA